MAFVVSWHVADELHVLNVATREDRRRRGLGRALMDHVVAYAREHALKHVLLEVRRSNAPAIALYRDRRLLRDGRPGALLPGRRRRGRDGAASTRRRATLSRTPTRCDSMAERRGEHGHAPKRQRGAGVTPWSPMKRALLLLPFLAVGLASSPAAAQPGPSRLDQARQALDEGRFADADRLAKQAAAAGGPRRLVALALEARVLAAQGKVDAAIALLEPNKTAQGPGGAAFASSSGSC